MIQCQIFFLWECSVDNTVIREQNSRSMTLDSGDAIELLIKALSCSFLYIFLLHSVSVDTFTTVKTKISMEKPYSIGLLIPFCISGRS